MDNRGPGRGGSMDVLTANSSPANWEESGKNTTPNKIDTNNPVGATILEESFNPRIPFNYKERERATCCTVNIDIHIHINIPIHTYIYHIFHRYIFVYIPWKITTKGMRDNTNFHPRVSESFFSTGHICEDGCSGLDITNVLFPPKYSTLVDWLPFSCNSYDTKQGWGVSLVVCWEPAAIMMTTQNTGMKIMIPQ